MRVFLVHVAPDVDFVEVRMEGRIRRAVLSDVIQCATVVEDDDFQKHTAQREDVSGAAIWFPRGYLELTLVYEQARSPAF